MRLRKRQRCREGWSMGQQLLAERDRRTAPTAGQKSVVSDTDETSWQNMQQETA